MPIKGIETSSVEKIKQVQPQIQPAQPQVAANNGLGIFGFGFADSSSSESAIVG